MTIYKSQSVTLKRAVVDIRGCTQKLAYTAVSRIISSDSLGILHLDNSSIKRFLETTPEDSAVKAFYQRFVGIDIPTKSIFYSDK